ncbi:hypothetical protein OG301_00490 [Streptomyces platensis]|nr:hypothetical protein OG301_00490 [Streptomyces platensis]
MLQAPAVEVCPGRDHDPQAAGGITGFEELVDEDGALGKALAEGVELFELVDDKPGIGR